MFITSQPFPGLVQFDFDSVAQLGKALIRPQEFAESPKFQGRIFTTSELKRHAKSAGLLAPYRSAYGVNIPGSYLDLFFSNFPSRTPAELAIKERLDSLGRETWDSKYYVIGASDGYTKHELAHALFYLDPAYKTAALGILARLPFDAKHGIKKTLLGWGIYAPNVIEDEACAYLATSSVSCLSGTFTSLKFDADVRFGVLEMRLLLLNALKAIGWKASA